MSANPSSVNRRDSRVPGDGEADRFIVVDDAQRREIEPQAVRLADDGKLFLEQRVEVLLHSRDHLGPRRSVYLVFTSLAVVSRPGLYR